MTLDLSCTLSRFLLSSSVPAFLLPVVWNTLKVSGASTIYPEAFAAQPCRQVWAGIQKGGASFQPTKPAHTSALCLWSLISLQI